MAVRRKSTVTRRHMLRCLTTGAATAVALPAYATIIEPRWLSVARHTAPIHGISNELRILHLSDLHYSRLVSLSFIDDAVEKGLELDPHVICLTGDYITNGILAVDNYQDVLSKLALHAPTFAVLGNHDGGRWAKQRGGVWESSAMIRLLQRSGITVLHNINVPVRFGRDRIVFCGTGDWWSDEMSVKPTFANSGRHPRVLLSHNPDGKGDLARERWQLMLCGHTHGGQISVPWVGRPFAPVDDTRYVHGLAPWRDRQIHVTSGVGNIHGARCNCRPEIALVTLVPATATA
jgi:predicted MPP superfamily phosphohydrolase